MSGSPYKSCTECHAQFANVGAQKSHRAGSWGDAAFPRRCRTESEMRAGGMWQSQRGVWHGEWAESDSVKAESGPVRSNAWQGRGSGKGDAA